MRSATEKNVRVALMVLSAAVLLAASGGGSEAGHGTRVKSATPTRIFVMAGFAADCSFKGYPDMQVTAPPAKGQVSFKTGEETTVQFSLSGHCVGTKVQGMGIYYTPAAGQSGEDTFTVQGRLGTGEPATRTFSVIIDENGNPQ